MRRTKQHNYEVSCLNTNVSLLIKHMKSIDINCDMAEGMGNERALMPYISSANIACGYHAGNTELMKETIALCLEFNVAIGAHPSFPDRKNFGRTNMKLAPDEINKIVTDQLLLLQKIADTHGAKIHHVKPHGALYNMAAKDAELARTMASAIKAVDGSLVFYGLSQSLMNKEAVRLQLKVAHEVFADRTYQEDGSLTPRSLPHALIESESESLNQVLAFINNAQVKTVNGTVIPLRADTLCLHGDGKNAVDFAKIIHSALSKQNILIKPI
jgi:UPF0271 protein